MRSGERERVGEGVGVGVWVERGGERAGVGVGRGLSGGVSSEVIKLEAQVEVANALEDTTELERPGDGLCAVEEVAHLHGITENPCRDDGDSEALARAGSVVGNDLRDREGSFDGESAVANEANIELRFSDRGQVDDGQDSDEVSQRHPISLKMGN